MIGEEMVEKACSEVGDYSDEQMVNEFDRFFREQPAICDFIVELTHESGQKIQELSLFLSYMSTQENLRILLFSNPLRDYLSRAPFWTSS